MDVLSQGKEVETIVSIGECTMDYSGCLVNLEQVRLIAKQRRGRAKQMNDGAMVAKGDTLVFLHADVLPPSSFFEDIEKTLSNGSDAGFFSYRFDRENFFLRINASFTRKKGVFTGGGDQCLFIKKAVFDRLGRFNENQVLMEDFEFFDRMKKAKVPYEIVNNDLVVSARKYEKNSYLKVNFSNLLLFMLFRFEFPAQKLFNLHQRLIK